MPLVPAKVGADHFLALARGALSAIPIFGGVSAELFAAVVAGPYERRMREWMDSVSKSLARVAERDESRFRALFEDDEFFDILLAATKAALNTNRREKTRWLANAVHQAANGTTVAFERRLSFVRFLDELTPSHIALLSALERGQARLSEIGGYADLQAWFGEENACTCTPEEFKLLCNDLESRVLARFSDTLADLPGLAANSYLITEDPKGEKVCVSELGLAFLQHIRDEKNES